MAASDFFSRWGKGGGATEPPPGQQPEVQGAPTRESVGSGALAGVQASDVPAVPAPPVGTRAQPAGAPTTPTTSTTPAPTPADLTASDTLDLGQGSDFRPFMARGVDEGVRRLALKKLFADPHFNIMDGLDTYIDDYNTFVPMDAALVASLNHGKALLDPLAQFAQPVMTLIDAPAAVDAPDTAPTIDPAASDMADNGADDVADGGAGEAVGISIVDPTGHPTNDTADESNPGHEAASAPQHTPKSPVAPDGATQFRNS